MQLYARIAELAYDESAHKLGDFRQTHRFYNEGTDTQGIAGVLSASTFVLAFRGTQTTNVKDFLTDINLVQKVVPYPDTRKAVKVHTGFIRAWHSIRDEVLHDIVRPAPYPNVLTIGHSLGGALATLAALDVQYNFPDMDIGSVTFGSPRVGNSEFAASYNRRVPNTTRVVNDKDLVQFLPLETFGYKHIGKLKLIGSNNLGVITEAIGDHALKSYIEILGGD